MNEWEKCVPWRRNFKLRTGDLLTEKYCDDLKVISGDHLLLLKVARDKILVMTYILNNVVTIWYHLKTEHDKLIRRQEISYCYGSLNKKVRWHAFTKAHLIKIEYCYGSLDQEGGDDWEHGAGHQLEQAVEPDAHLVQNVVIARQLQ